jgi:hypothetical protein
MCYVNHGSIKGLAQRFLRIKGTRIGRVYMMLVEEYRGEFFGEGRKLSC